MAERFQIQALAGSGGMGSVYRALDTASGHTVALKLINGAAPDDVIRFEREARLLADLDHPAIVRYLAHGVNERGEPYLAMEWLEGQTLAERLGSGPLDLSEALALTQTVVDALAVAHQRGVIHRDIKPGNVFLVGGRTDHAKLLDFGIARTGVAATRQHTMPGVVLGTLGYMAPEQAAGTREIDTRADVFSVGCVLFECIAGRPPFAGESSVSVLAKILLEEPTPLSDLRPGVPPALEDLVQRMLAKDPEGRPRDAAALSAELRTLGSLRALPADLREPARSIGAREKRIFSVVLLDRSPRGVAGSTAPTLRPQQAWSSAQALRAAVRPHGGTLDTLADGSVVVSFAGAGAATDQAAAAARSALALRGLLPDAPVSLATGRAEATGRGLVGEALDRAARLTRASGAGPVRLDEVTAGLLGPRFEVRGDPQGLILAGEREASEVAPTLLGRPSPWVGRETEEAALLAAFEDAQAGRARAVLVTAPPGQGKSRLGLELVRAVRRLGDVEVWTGRGDPTSAGSSFGMLAGALRRAAGVLEGEAPAVAWLKLRARVARHVRPVEVERVTQFLGEMLGLQAGDDEAPELRGARGDLRLMGDQITRAFQDLLAAEAEAQPVVILLEDLHWGDLPSVRLVDAALRNLRQSRLFVLALARPEIRETFPRLWAGRGLTEIELPELPRAAAQELARSALGGAASAALIDHVVDRAAGNAFYLEELVRAVARGEARLPETVLAMVQARLDALEPEARRILRAASIFGQRFWRGGVTQLLGGEGEAGSVADWLPELESRELVHHRPVARFPGEEEFAFRHSLVREAAYAMLTEHDRALGHFLAAEWLESAGEHDASALAEHYERGGDPERARAYFHRGAEQAVEGNDFEAALARSERAVSSGASGALLADLRLLQSQVLMWKGDFGGIPPRAEEAFRLAAPGSETWFAAQGRMSDAAGRLGDRERLERVARDLLDADTGPRLGRQQVLACAHCSVQARFMGAMELSRLLTERVMRARPEAESDPVIATCISRMVADTAYTEGDLSTFVREMERVVAGYHWQGNLRAACYEGSNLGFGLLELGAYERAEEVLRSVLAQAERMGMPNIASSARQNLGLAVARLGRVEEGLEIERRSVDDFLTARDVRMAGGSAVYLAKIHLEAGQAGEALAAAGEAVGHADAFPSIRAGGLACRAEAQLLLGDLQGAIASEAQAEGLLDAGVIEEGEVHVRLVLADVRRAAGDPARAAALLRESAFRIRARAEKIGDPALRRSFLERVPENRRTLELAG